MKIINREMGGGKTHALVEIMLAPGNEDVLYVAPTRDQAYRIAYEYAKNLSPNVQRGRFITAADIEHNRVGARYVIDEIDTVLNLFIGTEVVAIAGTDEDVRRGQERRMGIGHEAEWAEMGKKAYSLGLESVELLASIIHKKDSK